MKEFWPRLEAYVSAEKGHVRQQFKEAKVEYICADLGIESIIQTGEQMKAGFAARITGRKIVVMPYLFRELTQTGAVIPILDHTEFIESNIESAEALDAFWGTQMHALRTVAIPKAIQEYRLSLFQRMDENQIRRIAYQLVEIKGSRGIARRFLQLVREEWKRPQTRGRQDRGKDPRRFDVINGIAALAAEMPRDATPWKLMQLAGTLISETQEQFGPISGESKADPRRHKADFI